MNINESMHSEASQGTFQLRSPVATDARAIWQMVDPMPDLDSNSPYAYLLLCSHFSATSLVARRDSELAGFVLGYIRPDEPSTAFVWQVAVAESQRGCGLGRTLIERWFSNCAKAFDVRFLEATVTPSNDASKALFSAFAATQNAPLQQSVAFPRALFPENHPHEDEVSLRIGPFGPHREKDFAS